MRDTACTREEFENSGRPRCISMYTNKRSDGETVPYFHYATYDRDIKFAGYYAECELTHEELFRILADAGVLRFAKR